MADPMPPTELVELEPDDADRIAVAALLGLTAHYVAPVYDGQTKTGVSYNLSAAAEWQLSSQLFLGGRMEFNNAWTYLVNIFNHHHGIKA